MNSNSLIVGHTMSPFGNYMCSLQRSGGNIALMHDGNIELASYTNFSHRVHIYIYGSSMSVTRRVGNRYMEWSNDDDLSLQEDNVIKMADAELTLILAGIEDQPLEKAIATRAAKIAGLYIL